MGNANPVSTITGQTAAGQYGLLDPTGAGAALQNALYGAGGSVAGGPMGMFNQNVGNVTGMTGPLAQTLAQIAAYQGRNALNLAGQNFANQGALGSGAAAQAFGQAIANPFAQAQAQLQQGQLGLAGQLLGASTGAYGQGLQAASNLMEHTGGLVAPTYYTNPAYTQQQQGKGALSGLGTTLGGNALSSLLGPSAQGAGSGLANLLGLGGAGGTAGKGAASAIPSLVGAMPFLV